jgi:hypothetical protein
MEYKQYKKSLYYSPQHDLLFIVTALGCKYYYFQSDMSGCVTMVTKHPKQFGFEYVGTL